MEHVSPSLYVPHITPHFLECRSVLWAAHRTCYNLSLSLINQRARRNEPCPWTTSLVQTPISRTTDVLAPRSNQLWYAACRWKSKPMVWLASRASLRLCRSRCILHRRTYEGVATSRPSIQISASIMVSPSAWSFSRSLIRFPTYCSRLARCACDIWTKDCMYGKVTTTHAVNGPDHWIRGGGVYFSLRFVQQMVQKNVLTAHVKNMTTKGVGCLLGGGIIERNSLLRKKKNIDPRGSNGPPLSISVFHLARVLSRLRAMVTQWQ